MAEIMNRLRADHANFEKLLGVLDSQIVAMEKNGGIDYDILRGAIDYFKGYPDQAHHPCEDAIFVRLKLRDPEAAARAGDLIAEHVRAEAQLHEIDALLIEILNEEEVERRKVIASMKRFVDGLRKHMAMEEERFFKPAEAALTAADWAALDDGACEPDPLFDSEVGARFDALRQSILRWHREGRTNG